MPFLEKQSTPNVPEPHNKPDVKLPVSPHEKPKTKDGFLPQSKPMSHHDVDAKFKIMELKNKWDPHSRLSHEEFEDLRGHIEKSEYGPIISQSSLDRVHKELVREMNDKISKGELNPSKAEDFEVIKSYRRKLDYFEENIKGGSK